MVPVSSLLSVSEEDLNQAAQDCPHHPAFLKNMIIEVETKKLTETFPEGTLSVTTDTIRGKVHSVNSRTEECSVTWNTEPTSQFTCSFANLMHLGYTCPDHVGSRGASWVSTPVDLGSKHKEGVLRPTRTPFQIFKDLAKAGLNPTDPDFLVGERKTLSQLLNYCLHDSGRHFASLGHYVLDSPDAQRDVDFSHHLVSLFKRWVHQVLTPIVNYHFGLPVFPREMAPLADIRLNQIAVAEKMGVDVSQVASKTLENGLKFIEKGVALVAEAGGTTVAFFSHVTQTQVGVVAGGKWSSEISRVMSEAHQTIPAWPSPEDSTFRHVCTVLHSSLTGSTAEDADRLLKELCEAALVEQKAQASIEQAAQAEVYRAGESSQSSKAGQGQQMMEVQEVRASVEDPEGTEHSLQNKINFTQSKKESHKRKRKDDDSSHEDEDEGEDEDEDKNSVRSLQLKVKSLQREYRQNTKKIQDLEKEVKSANDKAADAQKSADEWKALAHRFQQEESSISIVSKRFDALEQRLNKV